MVKDKLIILRSRDPRVINSVVFNERLGEFSYVSRVTDEQLALMIKRGYNIASYSLAIDAELKIPQTSNYPAFDVKVIPKRGMQPGEDKYEIVVDGMLATKFREREKDDMGKRDPDNINYNYNVKHDSRYKESDRKQPEKGIELER